LAPDHVTNVRYESDVPRLDVVDQPLADAFDKRLRVAIQDERLRIRNNRQRERLEYRARYFDLHADLDGTLAASRRRQRCGDRVLPRLVRRGVDDVVIVYFNAAAVRDPGKLGRVGAGDRHTYLE